MLQAVNKVVGVNNVPSLWTDDAAAQRQHPCRIRRVSDATKLLIQNLYLVLSQPPS